jgi:hypothetical protein
MLMRSWPVVPLVPLLVTAVAATPAGAAPSTSDTATGFRPVMTTIATGMAARTDRRPVAGGLYDARAQTTFVSWAGQFEDNYVQSFDHRSGVWSAPVRVGDGGNDSHNYPTMVQPRGWHTREVATGVRVRSMEPVGPLAWRVYTTVDGGTGIGTALLVAGRWWHAESTIATAKPVQRVEVIDGYRDPARLLVIGASSSRDVTIADGDVAVLGLSCTS